MFKRILLVLVAVSFIACAGGPSSTPTVNTTQTESGDTLWSSGYTPGNVQIDKEFKYLGVSDRSDQHATRKYYGWKKDDNTYLYIVDFKSRGTWSFPKSNDGLLSKDNNPNDPDLLAYEPFKYSVWREVSSNAKRMFIKLGGSLPGCLAAFEMNKISPSRSAAFFVIYIEGTDCDYKGWGGIGKRATEIFTIN